MDVGYSTFWSAATALASHLKKQSFKPLPSSCHCTSASHSEWKKLLNYSLAAWEWWQNPPWFTGLEQTWKVWYSCSPSNLTIRVSILFILWVCLATERSAWTISEHYFMWSKRNCSCSYKSDYFLPRTLCKTFMAFAVIPTKCPLYFFSSIQTKKKKNPDNFKYPCLTCIHFFSGFK